MDTQPKSGGSGNVPVKSTAACTVVPEPHKPRMLPVWFFIGVLLLVYGVLILIQGIVEFSHPPDTVLSNLHPALWWGILLLAIGAIFTLKHRPKKT
jgi:hypothetical protein